MSVTLMAPAALDGSPDQYFAGPVASSKNLLEMSIVASRKNLLESFALFFVQ
jgi:hypothetical protein